MLRDRYSYSFGIRIPNIFEYHIRIRIRIRGYKILFQIFVFVFEFFSIYSNIFEYFRIYNRVDYICKYALIILILNKKNYNNGYTKVRSCANLKIIRGFLLRKPDFKSKHCELVVKAPTTSILIKHYKLNDNTGFLPLETNFAGYFNRFFCCCK
jgi:hypothetical protein